MEWLKDAPIQEEHPRYACVYHRQLRRTRSCLYEPNHSPLVRFVKGRSTPKTHLAKQLALLESLRFVQPRRVDRKRPKQEEVVCERRQ